MSEYPGASAKMDPPIDYTALGDVHETLFSPDAAPGIPEAAPSTETDELDDLTESGVLTYDDARRLLGEQTPNVDPKLMPHVQLYEHFQNQKEFIDVIAENEKLQGFIKYLQSEEGKVEYKQSDAIIEATKAKIVRNIHRLRGIYQTEQLKKAGYDADDVDDAFNTMRVQMQREYLGKENKSKRDKRRKDLAKLAAGEIVKIDPWEHRSAKVPAEEPNVEEEPSADDIYEAYTASTSGSTPAEEKTGGTPEWFHQAAFRLKIENAIRKADGDKRQLLAYLQTIYDNEAKRNAA